MVTSNSHDTGYKLLFSHPEMVRDLLLQYVPGPWVEQADFTSLERVNASYVSESERQRHDDMVWRLKVGDKWVWVYLMLEFQSDNDPWMALRMMVYVGLLAQHLHKEGELQDGLIPQILPIVLYNGSPVWSAPIDVADCFAPGLPGLEDYRPKQRYHLIDEARLKLHPLPQMRNLAEALFRLERSRTPLDMRDVLLAFDAMLKEPDMRAVRRTVTLWVRLLLRRKAPQANIQEIDEIDDILEAKTMLEETIGNWFEDATKKGRSQGLAEGLTEGLAKGVTLQLRLRFGPVPAWAQERIDAAPQEQLLGWMASILTVGSLLELFEPDGSQH